MYAIRSYYEVDVTHTGTADLGCGDFNATLLTDDAFVTHLLVFAAQTLVIADRSEDLRTEQSVSLGFEGSVINGLGRNNFV